MFSKIGQIMLYVDNQDEAVNFWTEKLGFAVVAEETTNRDSDGLKSPPDKVQQPASILHNKEFVAKMSPGLNLDTPSLMFFTDNLDQLHQDLSNKNIAVGEIMNMPSGRVFNFPDNEENYFAVMEKR